MQSKDDIKREIYSRIEEIRGDNIHGATYLTLKAIDIVHFTSEILHRFKENEKSDILRYLCNNLKSAQPRMASILNLSLGMNRLIEGADPTAIDNSLRSFYESFEKNFKEANERIPEIASSLVESGNVICTHSSSSLVKKAIMIANRSYDDITAICTESRPALEGIDTAKSLSENGVNTKLITDSAVFKFLQDSDIVLVGADHVSEDGVENKVGTLGISSFCKKIRIPVYALCQTSKIIRKDLIAKEEKKDPREIMDEKIEGLEVLNYYFESSPLDNFQGIVTEKGILNDKEIIDMIG
mgnify:CR=1 FL=1